MRKSLLFKMKPDTSQSEEEISQDPVFGGPEAIARRALAREARRIKDSTYHRITKRHGLWDDQAARHGKLVVTRIIHD